MGGVGEFTRGIADGISGLVAGAVAALIDGFNTMVTQMQVWLPGPLFPIVVGGTFLAVLWWTLKK
jgi:hypothetical protein